MPIPGPEPFRGPFLRLLRSKITARYALTQWLSVCLAFLAVRKASKDSHIWAWLPTVVLALVPWGTSMLNVHPCFAWACWISAFGCAAYAGWRTFSVHNWLKFLTILLCGAVVGIVGARSLYRHTELSFPFVNPGVFLVQGYGQWVLMVTGENTHVPLFNVDMLLQDAGMAHSAQQESDMAKRLRSCVPRCYRKSTPR